MSNIRPAAGGNSLSIRSASNVLLLGGGGHRTGKNLCQCSAEEKENYGYTFLRKMVTGFQKAFLVKRSFDVNIWGANLSGTMKKTVWTIRPD